MLETRTELQERNNKLRSILDDLQTGFEKSFSEANTCLTMNSLL